MYEALRKHTVCTSLVPYSMTHVPQIEMGRYNGLRAHTSHCTWDIEWALRKNTVCTSLVPYSITHVPQIEMGDIMGSGRTLQRLAALYASRYGDPTAQVHHIYQKRFIYVKRALWKRPIYLKRALWKRLQKLAALAALYASRYGDPTAQVHHTYQKRPIYMKRDGWKRQIYMKRALWKRPIYLKRALWKRLQKLAALYVSQYGDPIESHISDMSKETWICEN